MESIGTVHSKIAGLQVEPADFWRAVADSVADLMLLVDEDGTILYANQSLPESPAAAVVGRSAFDFVPHECRDELRRSLGNVFRGAGPSMREQRTVHADGRERWYSTHTAPLRVEARVVAAVVIAREVSGRYRAEPIDHDSQRMDTLGQLAAGIVHDFNNVLAIVGTAAQLIAEESVSPECARADAETILAEITRGRALTRQLLAFTRGHSPHARDVDLNAVVREVATILRRVMGTRIQIIEDLAPDGAWLHANRSQMEQVVMNLLLNARDAISGNGAVTVSTRADEASVRLCVTDTGSGMTDDIRRRLFEPFFTTKTRTGGSGLGLWTVHSIVSSTGGVINVTSTPGAGTTFELCFPARPEGEQR